jgi:hypothetical protein
MKWNTKIKKVKFKSEKLECNFLGNDAASNIKMEIFRRIFCFLKISSGSGTGTGAEPKLFRGLNRNRNKTLRFHNTGREDLTAEEQHWKSLLLMLSYCIGSNPPPIRAPPLTLSVFFFSLCVWHINGTQADKRDGWTYETTAKIKLWPQLVTLHYNQFIHENTFPYNAH